MTTRTPVCPLLVHDTMATLPATNGLARLDFVRRATIWGYQTDCVSAKDEQNRACGLTRAEIRHLVARRGAAVGRRGVVTVVVAVVVARLGTHGGCG